MWRVYKHTGTDKDYDAYKEALNAATNEVTKSKRNFEHKLAQNIKSDSKSFYAYVRSKQNVRDKIGPLEDNAGNIITQGFLMVEEDRKCTTILVLLDLSCAFDTINRCQLFSNYLRECVVFLSMLVLMPLLSVEVVLGTCLYNDNHILSWGLGSVACCL